MHFKICTEYCYWNRHDSGVIWKSPWLYFVLKLLVCGTAKLDWILDRTFERSFAVSDRFSRVSYSVTSSRITIASFSDLTLDSFDAALTSISSSLSSSGEFWEVYADRLEKNSSSQLAVISAHVGRAESALRRGYTWRLFRRRLTQPFCQYLGHVSSNA